MLSMSLADVAARLVPETTTRWRLSGGIVLVNKALVAQLPALCVPAT
jgi:hypothetical protein